MFKYSELDIENIKPLKGNTCINRNNEIMKLLAISKTPIVFTGASGIGKTHSAKKIAARYAKKYNVPAYFIQLSPDQTKSSIILGLRLINGSLQVENGVVADCMVRGGIIVVDEATHATQSLLLMFNSLMDKESITSIGDKIIVAKDTFRIIFCCNDSNYSGNIKLPQSFCNRVITYHFDYPELEEEIEIACGVLESENIEYNEDILKYLIKVMRQLRNEEIPLSVRNICSAMLLLSVKRKVTTITTDKPVADNESRYKKMLMIIRGIEDINSITKNDILEEEVLFATIGAIGINTLNEIVKQSFMYYLDFDGLTFSRDVFRNQLEGLLL